MRYQSQKVALVYFAGALLLFVVQVLVGTLAGVVYVLPNVLSELVPFNIIRMIHTNALIVWLLMGFFGAGYYLVPEEAETELKASAFLAAIREAGADAVHPEEAVREPVGKGVRVLLVDHEDSFVHTLANYIRQTGAEVTTVRTPVPAEIFDRVQPDLVVLSPGPGNPADFDCRATIDASRRRGLPIFGVCLGLQALAEAYGGTLRTLHVPVHGKPSRIRVNRPGVIFEGLPSEVTVGRYHSIFADPVRLPRDFDVTAETDDGVVMAFEHRSEPVAAVQFHPESIMSLGGEAGMRMIENIVANLPRKVRVKAA